MRTHVLKLLATGDRICIDDARKKLLPPPPPEPSIFEMSMADMLMSLPGRMDRADIVASQIALQLNDRRSLNFYLSVVHADLPARVPAGNPARALRQATGPQAKKPGAIFATAWKRETRLYAQSGGSG